MKAENKINTENTQMNQLYDLAKTGKLTHALLLESVNENERLNVALNIAKNLTCTTNSNFACDTCENCWKITRKIHPDITLICTQEEKTKSIKIDDIRNIRQDAYIIPNEGHYKIYIISDGDYITVQAQNALIKILEEPPKNVIFIILCSSVLNLLDTVRSRSQHFIIDKESKSNSLQNNDLSENIATASMLPDKFKVMELVSKIPHDRVILKKNLNNIVKIFIDKCAKNMNNSNALLKKIDTLRYIIKIIDNNINFNLLMCYLCANL